MYTTQNGQLRSSHSTPHAHLPIVGLCIPCILRLTMQGEKIGSADVEAPACEGGETVWRVRACL